MELLYKDESYRIIGACFEVYKDKGNGFVEPVYQECLEMEFGLQGVPFSAQAALRLTYKGQELKQRYIPNFMCYEKIIVELKAVDELAPIHQAQVISYLKATGRRLALLINFNVPVLRDGIKRIILS